MIMGCMGFLRLICPQGLKRAMDPEPEPAKWCEAQDIRSANKIRIGNMGTAVRGPAESRV